MNLYDLSENLDGKIVAGVLQITEAESAIAFTDGSVLQVKEIGRYLPATEAGPYLLRRAKDLQERAIEVDTLRKLRELDVLVIPESQPWNPEEAITTEVLVPAEEPPPAQEVEPGTPQEPPKPPKRSLGRVLDGRSDTVDGFKMAQEPEPTTDDTDEIPVPALDIGTLVHEEGEPMTPDERHKFEDRKMRR
jgi:hypothetical protein